MRGNITGPPISIASCVIKKAMAVPIVPSQAPASTVAQNELHPALGFACGSPGGPARATMVEPNCTERVLVQRRIRGRGGRRVPHP